MPNTGSSPYAKRLWRQYHGRKDINELIIDIEKFPKSLVYMGRIKSLIYKTDRITNQNPKGDKEIDYIHEFKDDRYLPTLFADPYGRFILVYANLAINDEGIVDRQDFLSSFNRTKGNFEENLKE